MYLSVIETPSTHSRPRRLNTPASAQVCTAPLGWPTSATRGPWPTPGCRDRLVWRRDRLVWLARRPLRHGLQTGPLLWSAQAYLYGPTVLLLALLGYPVLWLALGSRVAVVLVWLAHRPLGLDCKLARCGGMHKLAVRAPGTSVAGTSRLPGAVAGTRIARRDRLVWLHALVAWLVCWHTVAAGASSFVPSALARDGHGNSGDRPRVAWCCGIIGGVQRSAAPSIEGPIKAPCDDVANHGVVFRGHKVRRQIGSSGEREPCRSRLIS
jgi:hypothetical protein